MNYKVIPTPRFKRQAKKLLKRYRSLLAELQAFEQDLMANPEQGQSLGQNAYKIRVAVKSKGKGKSGGVRVITCLITEEAEIYLLTIYDKSEVESVDDKNLKEMIKEINE
ncbi:MAG: type II toxin-antitoxin system RelE/ParE family toxin [Tunicatimonas sp.]|uniref:type II toxin-antitoxin system RelE family toxin n=1 Tax=Tunicatimonas sp. TaxID=1940096 RepID=UPI003C713FC7